VETISIVIHSSLDREKELFKRALEKNRPRFVEYFLAASFDPLTLVETGERHTIISNLYKDCHTEMNKVCVLLNQFFFLDIK